MAQDSGQAFFDAGYAGRNAAFTFDDDVNLEEEIAGNNYVRKHPLQRVIPHDEQKIGTYHGYTGEPAKPLGSDPGRQPSGPAEQGTN
jgi:hypothetical protein